MQKGKLPSFLVSWHLYLTSITVFELPNYDLLHKLLRNSWTHWQISKRGKGKHASLEEDCTSEETDVPILAGKKFRPNPLLAVEE